MLFNDCCDSSRNLGLHYFASHDYSGTLQVVIVQLEVTFFAKNADKYEKQHAKYPAYHHNTFCFSI